MDTDNFHPEILLKQTACVSERKTRPRELYATPNAFEGEPYDELDRRLPLSKSYPSCQQGRFLSQSGNNNDIEIISVNNPPRPSGHAKLQSALSIGVIPAFGNIQIGIGTVSV